MNGRRQVKGCRASISLSGRTPVTASPLHAFPTQFTLVRALSRAASARAHAPSPTGANALETP
jgi:hypothetical protein